MSKVYFNLEELMWQSRIKSIHQLSEKTGISRETLTAIKDNKRESVRLGTLIKLCDHLNCSINDLLKYEKVNNQ
jgi:DNA-binding Xre family transcriptional regulator